MKSKVCKTILLVLCVTIMIVAIMFRIGIFGTHAAEYGQNATPKNVAHLRPIPTAVIKDIVEEETVKEPQTNFMKIMIDACMIGDYNAGRLACKSRNQKIDGIIEKYGECIYPKVDFDELMLLSKIMHAEAGGALWLPDKWVMCVGEVVLNRVASVEFPDTVSEVIYQRGQYYGSNSTYFNNLLPNKRTILIAIKLLEGERYMNEPSVVFQAEFRQGSGIHTQFTDKTLGTTYFCISSYPSKYK